MKWTNPLLLVLSLSLVFSPLLLSPKVSALSDGECSIDVYDSTSPVVTGWHEDTPVKIRITNTSATDINTYQISFDNAYGNIAGLEYIDGSDTAISETYRNNTDGVLQISNFDNISAYTLEPSGSIDIQIVITSPVESTEIPVLVRVSDTTEAIDGSTPFTGTTYSCTGAISVTTGPEPTVPGVVSFTGIAGDSEVVLNWDFVPTATHYRIVRGGDTTIYSAGDLTFTDTDVENGTTYSYQIYAVNDIGDGEWSTPQEFTPEAPPPDPGITDLTLRDIKLISLALASFIAYLTMKQFRFKRNA